MVERVERAYKQYVLCSDNSVFMLDDGYLRSIFVNREFMYLYPGCLCIWQGVDVFASAEPQSCDRAIFSIIGCSRIHPFSAENVASLLAGLCFCRYT